VNDPPVLSVPGPQTVKIGETLRFTVSASDVDGPQPMISATGMPVGATLTRTSGGGAGSVNYQFSWAPGPNQAGTYDVTFIATDSGNPPLSDTKKVTITVKAQSLFDPPSSKSINEGQELVFDLPVTSDSLNLVTITSENLPEGATLSDPSPTGPQRFRWTPNFLQAGEYTVTFKATMNSEPPLIETRAARITVFDVQHDMAYEPVSLSIFGAAGRNPKVVSDNGDAFGSSLAFGDLNGDGFNDLIVGAPNAKGSATNMGKVYVFFGKPELNGAIDLAQQKADVEFIGPAAGSHLGASL